MAELALQGDIECLPVPPDTFRGERKARSQEALLARTSRKIGRRLPCSVFLAAVFAAAAAFEGWRWYEGASTAATTLREAAVGTGIYVGTALNSMYQSDATYSQTAAKEFSLMTEGASTAATTLREAAVGTGIYVGTALNSMYQSDATYSQTAAKEFSLMTPANGCKMNFVAVDFTRSDYTRCKSLVDYAKKNSMAFRAHGLIWGAPRTHNPAFVRKETNATVLEEYMLRYINETMANIGSYPFAWDVVNEAVENDEPQTIKTSPWSAIDGFICKAFKAARKAQPNAQLFYNDYKHAAMAGKYKTKSDKVYEMVKTLKENNCGIDGVGFQNHIDISYTDENIEAIRSNMQRYNDIGIKVHITEMDVRCNHSAIYTDVCNVPNRTWNTMMLQRQAEIYSKLLKVCLEEPNCLSFESWGYTDAHFYQRPPAGGRRSGHRPAPQNPYIMDAHYGKKPAYDAMLATLNSWDKSSSVSQYKLNPFFNKSGS